MREFFPPLGYGPLPLNYVYQFSVLECPGNRERDDPTHHPKID